MRHTKKKISRVVDELITFFYSVGGNTFDIKIREDGEQHAIFFRSNYDPSQLERVNSLCHYLQSGRSPSIEESYWGLAGGGDMEDESELQLIGAMLDHADIKIDPEHVTFYLYRNRDNY